MPDLLGHRASEESRARRRDAVSLPASPETERLGCPCRRDDYPSRTNTLIGVFALGGGRHARKISSAPVPSDHIGKTATFRCLRSPPGSVALMVRPWPAKKCFLIFLPAINQQRKASSKSGSISPFNYICVIVAASIFYSTVASGHIPSEQHIYRVFR